MSKCLVFSFLSGLRIHFCLACSPLSLHQSRQRRSVSIEIRLEKANSYVFSVLLTALVMCRIKTKGFFSYFTLQNVLFSCVLFVLTSPSSKVFFVLFNLATLLNIHVISRLPFSICVSRHLHLLHAFPHLFSRPRSRAPIGPFC